MDLFNNVFPACHFYGDIARRNNIAKACENPSLMLQFRYDKKSIKRQAEGTDGPALPGQVSGQPDMEYAMVDTTRWILKKPIILLYYSSVPNPSAFR